MSWNLHKLWHFSYYYTVSSMIKLERKKEQVHNRTQVVYTYRHRIRMTTQRIWLGVSFSLCGQSIRGSSSVQNYMAVCYICIYIYVSLENEILKWMETANLNKPRSQEQQQNKSSLKSTHSWTLTAIHVHIYVFNSKAST